MKTGAGAEKHDTCHQTIMNTVVASKVTAAHHMVQSHGPVAWMANPTQTHKSALQRSKNSR